MARKKIRFGIIGLGLMGREFASATARWCHLLDDSPVPEIIGICSRDQAAWDWYKDNFPSIRVCSSDYCDLLSLKDIDAVYCAVPHNYHEQIYVDILAAGKHLLGEKPFGIDETANASITQEADKHPELVVKCSSEFPYYPGAAFIVEWLSGKKFGRIMEVRAGFNHSSDLNPLKPVNWKRQNEFCGEYGCMGDLGMHVHHIPLRMGWNPISVYADLQKITNQRPDEKGGVKPCDTWDNATLVCKCMDPVTFNPFTLYMETKRMAPGAANSWFIEIYGTEGSAKFSTSEPRTVYTLSQTENNFGAWARKDIGAKSYIPVITGDIFETGFSDAFQQMIGAYMQEFRDEGSRHVFPNVSVKETVNSHKIMSAALESHKTSSVVSL